MSYSNLTWNAVLKSNKIDLIEHRSLRRTCREVRV